MNDFNNKSIAITGASSGIGKALALSLAKKNTLLILAARTEKSLLEVVEACKKLGASAIAVVADVTVPTDCEKIINSAIENYGKLDILINNAGRSMCAKFDEITDITLFESLMKVNYLGAVYCSYYAVPFLKKTQGQIVTLTSITGIVGTPTRTGYSAGKHALHGFFDSLRIELTAHNVNILLIVPGYVATGIRERAFNAHGVSIGDSPYCHDKESISVNSLVNKILTAIKKRKREIILPNSLKWARLAKIMFPKLLDKISKKIAEER